MIHRILINNSPAFKRVEIEVYNGFNVISGVSGSGKSVFLNAILSAFGLKDALSELVEINLDSLTINLEEYGILNEDELTFCVLKKQNTRYFINAQSMSRKKLAQISTNFVKYISIRDGSELESDNILNILDTQICKKDSKYKTILNEFKSTFKEYMECKNELDSIQEKEKNIENLREFAKFEIEKIESINPQIGEYEKLLEDKKNLSKKEKVISSCSEAIKYLDSIDKVSKALELLNMDNAAFHSVMLDVRANLENALNEFENLEIEPEALLDRISALADIIRRYGSEKEALHHLKDSKEKLKEYDNIEFDKNILQKKYKELESKIHDISTQITKKRTNCKNILESRLNHFANKLRLNNISLNLSNGAIKENGSDIIEIMLDSKNKNVLSSGEYNRVRLSILCAMVEIESTESKTKKPKNQSQILILDEIDANLSGEESEGVAELLAFLSQKYQIFAISHQPFMPLLADNHYLVSKDSKGNASIKLLDNNGKIKEIARMISGSNLDSNAIEYATTLLNAKKAKKG